MYVKHNCTICIAEPKQYITDFSEQVIRCRNEYNCFILAVFNGIYIEVDETMTAEDIEREYLNTWEEM